MTTVYKQFFTRPMPLVACQIWDLEERVEFPKSCENLTFYEPLFIYTPGRGVGVYYNETDLHQVSENAINYFNADTGRFLRLVDLYESKLNVVHASMQNVSVPQEFAALLLEAGPAFTIGSIMSNEFRELTAPHLLDRVDRLRKKSDTIFYPALAYLYAKMRDSVSEASQPYAPYLLLEEHAADTISDGIKARRGGYIFYKGGVYLHDPKEFARSHDFILENDEPVDQSTITGMPVWRGKVTGRVRVIYELEHLTGVETGDILVTPMTMPEYLPAMRKAAAIVTDEGGITCHAAIIARELRKPCIVGAKHATRFLKTGDIIEVDAEQGIVKIIEKAR